MISYPWNIQAALGGSPVIRRNLGCVNCTRGGAKLLHRLGVLQVHHLVIAPDNASPDHFRCPPFFRHLVGVQSFSQTDAAVGAVRAFKTRAQAGVAMSAVTVAVAWHLVHGAANPGGCFIAFYLYRLRIALRNELLLRQDRRKFFAWYRGLGMKSRKVLWTVHLGLKGGG